MKKELFGFVLLSLIFLSSTCYGSMFSGGSQACQATDICEQGECILDEASKTLDEVLKLLDVSYNDLL